MQQEQEQNTHGLAPFSVFSCLSSRVWFQGWFVLTYAQAATKWGVARHLPQPLQPQSSTSPGVCMVMMTTRWCDCKVTPQKQRKKKKALNLYWSLILNRWITGILFSNACTILGLPGWDRRMQVNRRDEEACLQSTDHVAEPTCCSRQRCDCNAKIHPQARLCHINQHRVHNFSLNPVSN